MRRLVIWLLLAVGITWPVMSSPQQQLLGSEAVDVWNHAWGYWYVFEALSSGRLPLSTQLVGAPHGGTLYFIDTLGALWALPITALLGPAVAYNVVMLSRVALAGLCGQLLARELIGPGAHTWIAGLASVSLPFLLCELSNGISEVCAVHWLLLTFLATARCQRLGRGRDWALLGLTVGLTAATTFYYGLIGAIMAGVLLLLGGAMRDSWRSGLWWKASLSAAVAAAIITPVWTLFRRSLHAPGGLIRRDEIQRESLLAHNAVDPMIFFAPGRFQSVDLMAEFGEAFLHTGYLRWSVLLLAVVGCRERPALRPWALAAVLSLLLGMGSYLWWGGGWLTLAGERVPLPFLVLLKVLPEVSITHPLRLSVGGQLLAGVLAAGGLAALMERCRSGVLATAAGALIVAEGLLGSAVRWPLPTADALIPDLYSSLQADQRAVLELPVEVGTTMRTSRYFWHQTLHTRPIPYTPDVRLASSRDPLVLGALTGGGIAGIGAEQPQSPDGLTMSRLRVNYGAVILNLDLAEVAGLTGAYEAALTPRLGEPETVGTRRLWRLPPATESDRAAVLRAELPPEEPEPPSTTQPGLRRRLHDQPPGRP